MPKDLFQYCYTSNTTSEKIKMLLTNLAMLDIQYKTEESGSTDKVLSLFFKYDGTEYTIKFNFKTHYVADQTHLEEMWASVKRFSVDYKPQENMSFNEAIRRTIYFISRD